MRFSRGFTRATRARCRQRIDACVDSLRGLRESRSPVVAPWGVQGAWYKSRLSLDGPVAALCGVESLQRLVQAIARNGMVRDEGKHTSTLE